MRDRVILHPKLGALIGSMLHVLYSQETHALSGAVQHASAPDPTVRSPHWLKLPRSQASR